MQISYILTRLNTGIKKLPKSERLVYIGFMFIQLSWRVPKFIVICF